ncbi:hypothetical protein FOZ62_003186, partial [Perkinsus olseni]
DAHAVDVLNVDDQQAADAWSVKLSTKPNLCPITIEDISIYGLVDSGSSAAFIKSSIVDKLVEKGYKLRIYPIRNVPAIYADGSKKNIEKEVLLQCCIANKVFILPLLVVDELSYDAILGRSVLGVIGTQIEYHYGTSNDVGDLQSKLQDAFNVNDNVQLASAGRDNSDVRDVSSLPVSESGGSRSHQSVAINVFAHVQIIGSDVIECNGLSLDYSILSSVADDDMALFDSSEEETLDGSQCLMLLIIVMLRIIEDLEDQVRDTPSQQYRLIFDWPYKDPKKANKSWTPDHLLAQLSDEQRDLWFKELDKYASRRWWQPYDDKKPHDALIALKTPLLVVQ